MVQNGVTTAAVMVILGGDGIAWPAEIVAGDDRRVM
jgi:hypothetical protein